MTNTGQKSDIFFTLGLERGDTNQRTGVRELST